MSAEQRTLFGGGEIAREAYARRTDPATSHSAAAGADTERLKVAILDALEAEPAGLTTLELEERLGIQRVSISPRMRPLQRAGRIQEAGTRACNGRRSIVWKAVERDA